MENNSIKLFNKIIPNITMTYEVIKFILIISFLLQLLIDINASNIICSFLALSISLITFKIVLSRKYFYLSPLQCISIIGFNFSIFSGPLILKTLELEPITYNLQSPFRTFGYCYLYQIVLLLCLSIYSKYFVNSARMERIRKFLSKNFRIFYMPSENEIWKIAIFCLVCVFLSPNSYDTDAVASGGILVKIVSGCTVFAYIPYLLPIISVIKNDNISVGYSKLGLVLYTIAIIVMGVVQNSRGAIFTGLLSLTLNIFMLYLLNRINFNKKILKKIFIPFFLIALLIPQFSDLAIAMINARGLRSDVSSIELLSETGRQFIDKDSLDKTREMARVLLGEGYSETYVRSPLFSRLIQTKFTDNVFSYDSVISGRFSDVLLNDLSTRWLTILPAPLINLFGININKGDYVYSTGDVLFSLENGGFATSFLTGSNVGHGYSIFGLNFYLISIPIVLIFFYVIGIFYSNKNNIFLFSPLILLTLHPLFSIFVGDSAYDPINYLLRVLPQNILIYFTLLTLFARK